MSKENIVSNFLNNFISTNEEVTVQTRMKLSRAAKRTSPRRTMLRKIRSKKRKTLIQLKIRAKNRIKDVLRHRVYKGEWKKLSLSQRAQIDKNINKKKMLVNKMVQRILPEVIRGESQRLRNINSSYDPRVDNFISTFIGEAKEPKRREPDNQQKTKRRQQNRENKRSQRSRDEQKRNAGDTANNIMVVRNTNGDVSIIDKETYNKREHEVLVPADKATIGIVEKYTKNPAFVNTKTSIKLFGNIKGAGESKEKSKKEDSTESQQMEKQPPPMVVATKKASKQDTYATTHSAEEMEQGIAFYANTMLGLTPEQMISMNLLDKSRIDRVISNQNESFAPSCQRAAEQLFKQYGGLFIKQSGRSRKDSQLTETAKSNGVRDRTPKSDLLLVDSKGKIIITLSLKIGDSQLTSGGTAETTNHLKWAMFQRGDILEETSKKAIDDFIEFFAINLSGSMRTSSGPVSLFQKGSSREGQNPDITKREELHQKATEMLNNILNSDKKMASSFVYSLMTGVGKFKDGDSAIASHIFSANRDGTDEKITIIDEDYCEKLLSNIKFQVRFKSSAVSKGDDKVKWREFKERKKSLGEKYTIEDDWRPYYFRTVLGAILTEHRIVNSFINNIFEQITDKKLEQIIPEKPKTNQESLKYMRDAFEYIGNDSFKLYQFFEDNYDFIVSEPVVEWTELATNTSSITNIIYINGKEFQVPVEQPYNYAVDGTMSSPLSEKYQRDYKSEYDNYHGKPKQRSNRSKRVLARRLLMRLGKVKKGDGKDVDHRDGNPQNNSKNNLRVRDRSENRADN